MCKTVLMNKTYRLTAVEAPLCESDCKPNVRLDHPSKSANITTMRGFDYLCEHLADKCSSKIGSKLLFWLAGPPTVQYNRWVECVMKTVGGGEFPRVKKKKMER